LIQLLKDIIETKEADKTTYDILEMVKIENGHIEQSSKSDQDKMNRIQHSKEAEVREIWLAALGIGIPKRYNAVVKTV